MLLTIVTFKQRMKLIQFSIFLPTLFVSCFCRVLLFLVISTPFSLVVMNNY